MRDIEIFTCGELNYHPMVDYESWRVAYLNSDTCFLPENIDFAQYHRFTDEVFVLLKGDCTLLTFGSDPDKLGPVQAQKMEPGVIYNVKKDVWHSHALKPNSQVLVVENRDTTNDNSPILPLDADMRSALVAAYNAANS